MAATVAREMIKSRSDSSPNELRRSQSNPPMLAIIPGQNDGTVMEMVPARSEPAVIPMVPARSNPAVIQMVPAQSNPTMIQMVPAQEVMRVRSNPPMVHENSGPVFFVAGDVIAPQPQRIHKWLETNIYSIQYNSIQTIMVLCSDSEMMFLFLYYLLVAGGFIKFDIVLPLLSWSLLEKRSVPMF